MSELINTSNGRKDFRWQLLATVSAVTLLAAMQAQDASAAESDPPTVWIELGGQLERVDAGEAQFVPPFIVATPRPMPETISPLSVGHAPRFSIGGEGKISLVPNGTDWVFSVAIRYGRSNASQHLRQQSPYPTRALNQSLVSHYSSQAVEPRFRHALQFIDTEHRGSESHAIVDFQAGRDVGMGLFGSRSISALNLGVRFAQFASRSSTTFKSDPDAHPKYFTLPNGFKTVRGGTYHSNAAAAAAARSFHGVGPSISWNGSAPVLSNAEAGGIALDWGINAAVLFGRQKARVHHQTTARYHKGKYSLQYNSHAYGTTLYRHTPPDQSRSRAVVVPNIGGFAGATFRIENFKMSAGYRADFFFGAMDGGIDAAKKESREFYGPFATISVGFGG